MMPLERTRIRESFSGFDVSTKIYTIAASSVLRALITWTNCITFVKNHLLLAYFFHYIYVCWIKYNNAQPARRQSSCIFWPFPHNSDNFLLFFFFIYIRINNWVAGTTKLTHLFEMRVLNADIGYGVLIYSKIDFRIHQPIVRAARRLKTSILNVLLCGRINQI